MRNFLKAPISNLFGLMLVIAVLLSPLAGSVIRPAELVPLSLSGGASNFSAVQVDDGTVGAPAIGFTDDTDNGLYRVGANNVGLAAGGTLVLDVNATTIDANALPITNIGNAGTDFSSAGGLTLAGTLAVTGVTTHTGALTLNNNLTVTGTSALQGVTTFSANPIRSTQSITPTDGGIFTPTAELVTLTPGGALGTEIGTCTTGTKTVLWNSVNATVTITESAAFVGSGNAALTQFDTLTLACFNSIWYQIGSVPTN